MPYSVSLYLSLLSLFVFSPVWFEPQQPCRQRQFASQQVCVVSQDWPCGTLQCSWSQQVHRPLHTARGEQKSSTHSACTISLLFRQSCREKFKSSVLSMKSLTLLSFAKYFSCLQSLCLLKL